MRFGDLVICPGCCRQSAMFRGDKHGRPMIRCACGCTVFFAGKFSWGVYELLYGPLSLMVANGDAENARRYVQQIEKEVANVDDNFRPPAVVGVRLHADVAGPARVTAGVPAAS